MQGTDRTAHLQEVELATTIGPGDAFVDEIRAARRLPSPAIARAIRTDAGVSQARAAREIGVHRLTVVRWETGERKPTGANRVEYARLLERMREAVT